MVITSESAADAIGIAPAAEWLMLRADRSRLVDADQGAGLARSAIGRRAVLGDRVEVRLVTLLRASAAGHAVSTVQVRPAAAVKQ